MKKKEIPWGRTLTTNDAFLGSHKTGSKKTRPVVVIETYEDELAVVPLSTTKVSNRTELKGYKNKFGLLTGIQGDFHTALSFHVSLLTCVSHACFSTNSCGYRH